MTDLIQTFQEGDPALWVILAAGIVALAVATERAFFVYVTANINGTAFMGQIQKLIMAGNIDRAIQLCNAEPGRLLTSVIKAGLTNANQDEEEVRNQVDEAMLRVTPLINKRTPYLGTLANVATLLGLLGTIHGLIQSFAAVSSASAEMKQTLLAAGIALSMHATMMGLIVAIPTLVAQALISAQSNRLLDDIEQYSLKTINLLNARRRASGSVPAAKAEEA